MIRALLFVFIAAGLSLGCVAFFGEKTHYDIVYHADDRFGGVWVYEEGPKRCLAFSPPPPAINQNCILVAEPYKLVSSYQNKIVELIKAQTLPSKLLVIGLGGGTLINALQQLLLQATIDVVEINPAIPSVAENYFHFSTTPAIKIIIDDGAEFIKKLPTEAKYDVIIVDAFTPDYVPPSFLTKEFVLNLKLHLSDDGVVMANSFKHHKVAEQEVALYKSAFNSVRIALAHNNRIIVAGRRF